MPQALPNALPLNTTEANTTADGTSESDPSMQDGREVNSAADGAGTEEGGTVNVNSAADGDSTPVSGGGRTALS